MNEAEKKQEILHLGKLENELYERQKRISWWNQNKISKAKVLLVGAGALGNEVCKNLAQCGVGKLIIVDFDDIEMSNLNRCILFTRDDVKKRKVKVMAKRITELFDIEAEPICDTIENLTETIYNEIDLAVSCLDNIDARLTLNAHCYYYNIPLVDGGTMGMTGRVQTVVPPYSACLQCRWGGLGEAVLTKKYSCDGRAMAFFEQKVPAVSTTTSIIGGIQAEEAIKVLQNIEYRRNNKGWPDGIEVLENHYLYYDGERNIINVTNVKVNQECEIHENEGGVGGGNI